MNKLILNSQDSSSRFALILEYNVTVTKKANHVSVEVINCSKSRVHAVEMGESLHRLLDSGDLSCKLYLAYLYVLISFYLPDPLTFQTGTEEALTMLRSKAVELFE